MLAGAGGQRARLRLGDTLREGAAELVAGLRARGIGVTLCSGDHAEARATR